MIVVYVEGFGVLVLGLSRLNFRNLLRWGEGVYFFRVVCFSFLCVTVF